MISDVSTQGRMLTDSQEDENPALLFNLAFYRTILEFVPSEQRVMIQVR